jgi:heme/copper-type cytochrome/quinol oxidase subunit 3
MIIFCIRDSLREYKSNYVLLSSMKLSFYNWFILSESAIFSLLFWSWFQHVLSPLYIVSNLWIVIIQMNSYDLSLKNTNLLSNSAILFGYHYIIGSYLGLIQGYLCSIIFMEGQVNEFTNLGINLNDSLLGWIFYNIDGWHFYHIWVGNLVISLIKNLWSWTLYLESKVMKQIRIRVHHMFYNMQIVYWHFVEMLWLVIYYVLYS